MKFEDLKYQILLNRKRLYSLYELQSFWKTEKAEADNAGRGAAEYRAHKQLKEVKSDVAKLVKLQKALKAEAAKELAYERAARMAYRMKATAMAAVGETF